MRVTRVMTSISLLPVLMLLILALFVLLQFRNIRSDIREAENADAILLRSSELVYLSDRYLLEHEPIIGGRLTRKLAQVSALAKEAKKGSGTEAVSIPRKLEIDTAQVGRLLQRYDESSGVGLPELRRRLRSALRENIVVRSRDIVATAQRLSQKRSRSLVEARQEMMTAIAAALLLLSVVLPVTTFPIAGRLSRSLTNLRDGISASSAESLTKVEDSGNFEEFSSIAGAYNGLILALQRSFKELEQKTVQLRELNATLNVKVLERTKDLSEANVLLDRMRKHSDSVSRNARLEAAKHHEEERRLHLLTEYTERILRHSTLSEILSETTHAAQEVLDARYAVVGHGDFHKEIAATKAGRLPCPLKQKFKINRGGVYLEILRKGTSVRLTQQDLLRHPAWWGLPDGHAVLRGLVAVPLRNERGIPFAVLMATDRIDGAEFTEEDERLLVHLAWVTGTAISLVQLKEEGSST